MLSLVKDISFISDKLLAEKLERESNFSTENMKSKTQEVKSKLRTDLLSAKAKLAEYTTCDDMAKHNEKEARAAWEQSIEGTMNDAAQYIRIRNLEDEEHVMRDLREFKEWLQQKLHPPSISTIFVADMRTRSPTVSFCEKRISEQLCKKIRISVPIADVITPAIHSASHAQQRFVRLGKFLWSAVVADQDCVLFFQQEKCSNSQTLDKAKAHTMDLVFGAERAAFVLNDIMFRRFLLRVALNLLVARSGMTDLLRCAMGTPERNGCRRASI